MGNKELNLAEPITTKIFKNFENENIRVGVCLMQGWRKTMEDISLVLPNFDGKNSLFGVFDGHGGSIISQFVACNIGNILKNSKSYQKLNYEQSLIDSFVILDELLKNNKIDRFLKKILQLQKNSKLNYIGHNGIINRELSKNNINNDPHTDYLFFSSSFLDHDTNLKYKFPDLQQYLNIKNNIRNNNNNDIYTISKALLNNLNTSINTNFHFSKKRSNSLTKSNSNIIKTDNFLKNIKNSFENSQSIEEENISMLEDLINKELEKPKFEMALTFKNTDEKDLPSLIANDIGTTANICLLKKIVYILRMLVIL